MQIRPYRPADLPALYRICLLTGDYGGDASGFYRDPLLVGHVFAAPYAILAPQCCLVAEDNQGVAGYIVGVRDTRDFEHRLCLDWWPHLRSAYLPAPRTEATGRTYDRHLLAVIHNPPRTPDRICCAYPSHLHINLLPRLQGQGAGKLLVDTWLDAMRSMASTGVHLATGEKNPRSVRFYRRYGFTELERSGRDRSIIWFGLRQDA